MKSAVWVSLSLILLAVAGCTEEPAAPTPLTCPLPGEGPERFEEVNATTGETEFVDRCVNIASAELSGLPATNPAYTPIDLTWTMHTDLAESHSHKNGYRISTESKPTFSGKADDYGFAPLGATEEHRNFVDGDTSTITWTPTAAGTYYVRAFAVSAATSTYWADEQVIEVTAVQPTGTQHTVTLSGGGLPQVSSVSPETLDIALGDEVQWTSSDPDAVVTWTLHFARPDSLASFDPYTVGDDFRVFPAPGQYRYTALATDPNGDEIGRITGNIVNVAFPE